MAMAIADRERAGEGELVPNEPAAAQEAPGFGPLDYGALRRHVITRQGKDMVLYTGLVQGLHTVSRGFFVIDTRLEQLPTAENKQVAVCSAQVRILDPESPEVVLRSATGIGDAGPENVSKMMLTAIIRMAETRAKARALRDLLGVHLLAFEELGPDGAEPGQDAAPPAAGQREPVRPSWGQPASSGSGAAPRPVAAPETIQVDGRTFGRGAVLDVYHTRLTEAERAGLQLGPMGTPGGPPNSDAPLAEIVRFSQDLKRRLEARAGAARASGK